MEFQAVNLRSREPGTPLTTVLQRDIVSRLVQLRPQPGEFRFGFAELPYQTGNIRGGPLKQLRKRRIAFRPLGQNFLRYLEEPDGQTLDRLEGLRQAFIAYQLRRSDDLVEISRKSFGTQARRLLFLAQTFCLSPRSLTFERCSIINQSLDSLGHRCRAFLPNVVRDQGDVAAEVPVGPCACADREIPVQPKFSESPHHSKEGGQPTMPSQDRAWWCSVWPQR